MRAISIIYLLFISLIPLVLSNDASGIQNKRIEREIDLTTQFSRHSTAFEVENGTPKSIKSVSIYVASSLAQLEVTEEVTGSPLTATPSESPAKQGKSAYTEYIITLAKELPPSSTVTFRVKAVHTHSMTPFPASIAQDERQLVKYFDNHFVYSRYPTSTQTTTVRVAGVIESKSEQAPTSVSGNIITYGPYEDIAPFSSSEMSVHFENNRPFLTATRLVKEIEISHWGANVAVEESYEIQHDGALLKGTFSRFDYQRTPPGKGSVVAGLKQVLPVGASDVYYRDEIGNISTSHLWEVETGPVMDVIPRYPLFGGWKIGFYFGYNLPSNKYLLTDGSGLYVLNVSFASAFTDITVDELVVRVILPEGAKNAQAYTPFAVDSQSTDIHFTYLDTAGRPVLVLTKKNVVPEHNKPFQVTYNFNSTSLLQEPVLLIGAYFLFFVLIMVYSRISIQIGTSSKEESD